MRLITQIIQTCNNHFTKDNQLSVFHHLTSETTHQDIWNTLQNKAGDGHTLWKHLETQVTSLENTDKEIKQAEVIRIGKQNELKRLREFSESILKLKTRRKTALATIEKAKKAIE